MLLLEKPVAINIEAAARLSRACRCHPKMVVAVNYIRRYLPVVLELQAQLKAGHFGELLHARLLYGKGLLSNGSHFVNLAEAWLGPLNSGAVVEQGPGFAGFDQEAARVLTASCHNDAVLHFRALSGRAGPELTLVQPGVCFVQRGRVLPLAYGVWYDSHRPRWPLKSAGMEHTSTMC